MGGENDAPLACRGVWLESEPALQRGIARHLEPDAAAHRLVLEVPLVVPDSVAGEVLAAGLTAHLVTHSALL